MPEPSGSDLTGPQIGIIATVIMGVGAFAARGITAIAKAWLNKDEIINRLHDDKFKVIIEEWKQDREASIEQQKLNAEATRHNTEATGKLEHSIKEMSAVLSELQHTLANGKGIAK